MDSELRDLLTASCQEVDNAGLRSKLTRTAKRLGQEVIWRGHNEYELQPIGTLVNEYFTPPAEQIFRVAALNQQLNLGLTGEDIANAWLTIPPWRKANLVALVLVWYQRTVQETFESACRAIQASHEKVWRWDDLKSDPNHLRILPGIEHPASCLRWEVIDLAANWDKENGIAPRDVRNPQTSPHAGIYAAAALHPTWVMSMDGGKVPFVIASGYQVQAQGSPAWALSPSLYFNHGYAGVKLTADHDDNTDRSWAVPVRE